jgi:leucine dehydrogenase
MKVYATPAEALEDAMRLSAAMTRKLAIAGLPFGGGKAVLAVPSIPSGEQRHALLLRYGDLVASLGGTYRTSSDINTNEADMDVIGERTEYVFGRSRQAGGSGNPAAPTAVGVFHGIRSSVEYALGSRDLEGRTVLVQGAGGVGSALAEHLAAAGVSVFVADIDSERAGEVAARVGGTAVDTDHVSRIECDVYAPCAVGGILSSETVERLRCRIVAGSANNQLAEPEAAELLRARGILYAPDYVINGGGAIALVGLEQLGWSSAELDTARWRRLGTPCGRSISEPMRKGSRPQRLPMLSQTSDSASAPSPTSRASSDIPAHSPTRRPRPSYLPSPHRRCPQDVAACPRAARLRHGRRNRRPSRRFA